MSFIKKWLGGWLFWLCLLVISLIVVFIDIHFDLSNYGMLSLIALLLALILFVIFLITWAKNGNGIKRLLTVVISTGAVGIIFLLLSSLRIFYRNFDLDFLLPVIRILFFISGTVLLLKLVWRKK